GLTAVVSDAPEGLRPRRRDLVAHEAVLAALATDGVVLPMRFGALTDSDDVVRDELSAHRTDYSARLDVLEDRVEINVKGFHSEDALLRELLATDAGLRQANEELRAAGGGTPGQRLDFGERVAAAVGVLQERHAEQVVAALRPYAAEARQAPAVPGAFLNVSFLVDEGRREEFEQVVDDLGRRGGGLYELRWHGPLPPYSFAAEPLPGEAAWG
ncbi:MAG: gas vesicle protein GvpFL, partial [Streptosporangiales bacterium]|nr:gas vesicle protein GvpFL [Streptosporangiales bacterium]